MSGGLANTIALFIVLIMIVSTLWYNYTILADYLDDNSD